MDSGIGDMLTNLKTKSYSNMPAIIAVMVVFVLLGFVATGFGASNESQTVATSVNESISITEPAALNNIPAPTTYTSWTQGSPSTLILGSNDTDPDHPGALSGQTTAFGSLTFMVTTNSPTGYQLTLKNSRVSGAVLMNGSAEYPDMGSTPAAHNTTVTAFGVSMGDAADHDETSVNGVSGSPWGTFGSGGTQGLRYAGIPAAGIVVAERPTYANNDPVTFNFLANYSSTQPILPGAYTGAAELIATVI